MSLILSVLPAYNKTTKHFYSQIDLIVLHSQEDEECADGKGHVCPHPGCNKVCSKAYKLKLHMLTHTGERPYKVHVCCVSY